MYVSFNDNRPIYRRVLYDKGHNFSLEGNLIFVKIVVLKGCVTQKLTACILPTIVVNPVSTLISLSFRSVFCINLNCYVSSIAKNF